MKRVFKIVAMALVPVYIAVFLIFILPRSHSQQQLKAETEIIQLWHVDMFEGGSGSRGDFLMRRAVEYEKQLKGKYILVKSLTYEQLLGNLAEGLKADIYSFGVGLAGDLLPQLCAFSGRIAIYDNLLQSGVVEDKVFGVPWCAGSYVIIGLSELLPQGADFSKLLFSSARQKGKYQLKSAAVGYARFNNPLFAAFASDESLRLSQNSIDEAAELSQYDAFSKFASKNHSVFLLGTQRDAVRISQREDAADFSMQPLVGFTDLICYLGISKDTKSLSLCNGFIEFVLSPKSQYKLSSLNMFSVNTVGLYTEGIMKRIEDNMQNLKTINAFTSKEILLEQRLLCQKALKGDAESAQKLSQLLYL
jgi:hypothetical protein